MNLGVEGETGVSAAARDSARAWWADAGVDSFVAESPRNWLAAPRAPAPVKVEAPRPAPARAPAPSLPIAPPQPTAFDLPTQLSLFRAWLAEAEQLPYAAPSVPRLCPEDNPLTALMVMVNIPSHEDCGSERLLTSKAGALFDRMLAAMGLTRDSIYLAALSCARSPSGLFDTAEARSCADIARHHIALVQPRTLLVFGDRAAKVLFGKPVTHLRGRWQQVDTPAGPVPAMVTFSPDSLLTNKQFKAPTWADLQMLMERLQ